jgi:hypothetical protein
LKKPVKGSGTPLAKPPDCWSLGSRAVATSGEPLVRTAPTDPIVAIGVDQFMAAVAEVASGDAPTAAISAQGWKVSVFSKCSPR